LVQHRAVVSRPSAGCLPHGSRGSRIAPHCPVWRVWHPRGAPATPFCSTTGFSYRNPIWSCGPTSDFVCS